MDVTLTSSRGKIIVGRDTRESGPLISAAVTAGAQNLQCKVRSCVGFLHLVYRDFSCSDYLIIDKILGFSRYLKNCELEIFGSQISRPSD